MPFQSITKIFHVPPPFPNFLGCPPSKAVFFLRAPPPKKKNSHHPPLSRKNERSPRTIESHHVIILNKKI